MENGNIMLFITSAIIVVIAIIAILYDNNNKQSCMVHDTCDTYQNTATSGLTEETNLGVGKSVINTNSTRFKYASPDVITQIYKLLYIIDKIFTENEIEFWMDGGTFLGAIRHKGIIPHDDDGDIQVWDHDEELIKSLQPELAKYNIILKPIWFGYKLYFNDAASIKGYDWKYPAIYIFPVKAVNNKLIYSYPKAQETWSKCYHDLETLFPLKQYKFGSFTLPGASERSVKTYMDRCYGSDWSTHAYQQFDHQNEKMIDNKVKIKLTSKELEPAQPIDFNRDF